MKRGSIWILLTVVGASLITLVSISAEAPSRPRLWAGVSVLQPVYRVGELYRLQVQFALVNDGSKSADPKVGSWRLNVNGKDQADSQVTFGNGPRDDRWQSLPAGERLEFSYALGDWFKTPGIYRVIWRGENFQSPPVLFRVIPDAKK